MPDRGNAEILKVIRRQISQNVGGDAVSLKGRRIAAHPEIAQPISDVHRRPSWFRDPQLEL
jgi:hypothetical protein